MYLGLAQSHAGQYDLGIRQLNQTIELVPHNYRSFFILERSLSAVDRFEEAIAALQKALSINPDNLEALAFLASAKAAAGDRQEALRIMKQVVAAESRTSPAILVAHIYARLGDVEQMYDWLRKAMEQKSVPIYLVLLSDEFRPYRSELRFHSFLESVGLSHLAKH
jgi:tetratricopeptide (TPR) repeat protein